MLSVLRTMSNTPKKPWRATSKQGFPPRRQKAAGSPPPPAAAFPRRWPAEGGEGVPAQPRIPQGTTAPFALPPSKTTSGGPSFNACDENPHMILLRKCTDTGLSFFFPSYLYLVMEYGGPEGLCCLVLLGLPLLRFSHCCFLDLDEQLDLICLFCSVLERTHYDVLSLELGLCSTR